MPTSFRSYNRSYNENRENLLKYRQEGEKL